MLEPTFSKGSSNELPLSPEVTITFSERIDEAKLMQIQESDFGKSDIVVEGDPIKAILVKTRGGLFQVIAKPQDTIIDKPYIQGEMMETEEAAKESCIDAIVTDIKTMSDAMQEYEMKTAAIEAVLHLEEEEDL